jgi:hypothetical protein
MGLGTVLFIVFFGFKVNWVDFLELVVNFLTLIC